MPGDQGMYVTQSTIRNTYLNLVPVEGVVTQQDGLGNTYQVTNKGWLNPHLMNLWNVLNVLNPALQPYHAAHTAELMNTLIQKPRLADWLRMPALEGVAM